MRSNSELNPNDSWDKLKKVGRNAGVGVMAVLALSSCGNGNSNKVGASTPETTSPEPSATTTLTPGVETETPGTIDVESATPDTTTKTPETEETARTFEPIPAGLSDEELANAITQRIFDCSTAGVSTPEELGATVEKWHNAYSGYDEFITTTSYKNTIKNGCVSSLIGEDYKSDPEAVKIADRLRDNNKRTLKAALSRVAQGLDPFVFSFETSEVSPVSLTQDPNGNSLRTISYIVDEDYGHPKSNPDAESTQITVEENAALGIALLRTQSTQSIQ